MSQPLQTFCLFLDPEVETTLPTQTTPSTQTSTDGLHYLEIVGSEKFVNQSGRLSHPVEGEPSLLLEPIRTKNQNSLLMTFEQGVRVTVNGLPATSVRELNPGDVLGIDEHVLYLSLLNRPYVGPPDETTLAAKCGFCRLPIQAAENMRVYVCPNCSLPTHNQGEESPAEHRLECTSLSSRCGHCQAEIVTQEGFTHVPVF